MPGKLFRFGNLFLAIPSEYNDIPSLLVEKPGYLVLPEGLQKIEGLIPIATDKTILVIDGNVPQWRARQWSNILARHHIAFYNTWESGALQLTVNKF